MAKTKIFVVRDGRLDTGSILKLVLLLLLNSLSIATALAINEAVRKSLDGYMVKNTVGQYAMYALIAFVLVIVFAYLACCIVPDIADCVDLSPI